ncbi:MAG: helix-turn-helix domain-containing protein [Patescibacteria group bacterium]|nr:helix-turn-helix domain-containing protein [Patescibacteria group bacterium]
MSKSVQRLKALALRRQGKSVKDIARELFVSRSSISIWCRDVILTDEQERNLQRTMLEGGHRGRMLGALRNKQKRLDTIRKYKEEGLRVIESMNKREFLIAGLALYWAEGSKKEGKLVFTNSDPVLIDFMKQWFQVCFGVRRDEFMPRLFIVASHKDRAEEVLKFWSSLLGLPTAQFGRPIFLKSVQKKQYENREGYLGVLGLGVRNGTDLKYKLIGLIGGLAKSKKPE